MRVLQSIWSLASENGGPTRSTIGLSKALGRAGVQVLLVSHVPGKVSQLVKDDLQSCGVAFREGRGNGFIVALRDAANLLEDCKPDIVHIQGLWKMSTHAMFVVAARHDIPVIIKYSPDPSKFLLSQTFPVLFNGYGVSVGEERISSGDG